MEETAVEETAVEETAVEDGATGSSGTVVPRPRASRNVSVRDLQRRLAELMDDVECEDTEIVVIRYRRPIARIVPVATIAVPRTKTARARLEVKDANAAAAPEVDLSRAERDVLSGVSPTGWYRGHAPAFRTCSDLCVKGVLVEDAMGFRITQFGRRVRAAMEESA